MIAPHHGARLVPFLFTTLGCIYMGAVLFNGNVENSAWRKQHGGLALIRCYEVFRSLHGLDIHWNGSQGSP